MGAQLSSHCEILLDDMAREREQEIVRGWPVDAKISSGSDPYAVIS